MGRSVLLETQESVLDSVDASLQKQEDFRLELAARIVASRRFSRSPLLSKFLLYVVTETIEGRAHDLSEHSIGICVFDRPRSYRTVEDNIVRSYARQLRRRLVEFFEDEGKAEDLRIEIPLGGYVPRFVPMFESAPQEAKEAAVDSSSVVGLSQPSPETKDSHFRRRFALILYTAIIFCSAWWLEKRVPPSHGTESATVSNAAAPLWKALLGGPRTTYIIPSDAGLNLIEDISQHSLPLAGYIAGGYTTTKLATVDAHSADDLRTQHFTSFVDLQIVSALSALPEYNSQHSILRFPRDVRVDDLKHANAIILGSEGSNPWASIVDGDANFRIISGQEMRGAAIFNVHPIAGEAARYDSHWNEPAHETYAIISYLPNLEGDGRLLILQGLDVAGTQAAGEAIIHPSAIEPILKRATRPDGSLRYFEILLRTTSIESNAMNTYVVCSRIY
jgi:hypothetical protein